MEKEFIIPKFNETKLIFLFSAVLALMFGFLFNRFTDFDSGFFSVLIILFLFIFLLLYLRLTFMKLAAYRQCFELTLHKQYLNQFYYKAQDKISYHQKNLKKGIPAYVFGIILYILTLGIFIMPYFWRYEYKKIPHLHIGSRQWLEGDSPNDMHLEVSDYRLSKVFLAGFIYYVIFTLILKLFISSENIFYEPFIFIMFYLAFFSLIPIFNFEGMELWLKNKFAWHIAITSVLTAFIYAMLLREFVYLVFFTVFTIIVITFYLFWRKLVSG
ncbi:MAG: hypothetical protein ACOCXG_03460 [Nanoarchaeota archaeon]